jgi:hypothetical protein
MLFWNINMHKDIYRTQHDLSPLSSGMRVPINLPLDHIDGIRSILRAGTEQIIRSHGLVSPQQRQNLYAFAADAYDASLEQVGLIAQAMNNPRHKATEHTLKQDIGDHARCGAMAQRLNMTRKAIGKMAFDGLWQKLGMDDLQIGNVPS